MRPHSIYMQCKQPRGKGMRTSDFLSSGKQIAFSGPIQPGSDVCFVDSSFNPPNNAHLKLSRLCRERFPGCVLVLLLSTGNADKPAVPPEELDQRVEMMNIVAHELGGDVKIGLTTEARFIDKARAVGQSLPRSRTVFAMGFDTLMRVGDSKYYEEPVEEVLQSFFANVEVLVLTREQDARSKMPELGSVDQQVQLESAAQFQPFVAKIHVAVSAADTVGVSSSAARSSVAELVRLTPPGVTQYVRDHKLYGLS